jgi:hypothetical protein
MTISQTSMEATESNVAPDQTVLPASRFPASLMVESNWQEYEKYSYFYERKTGVCT